MFKGHNLRVLVAVGAAVMAAGALSARADVYMKQKTNTGAFTVMGQSQPEKNETMVMWLGANKARTDLEAGKSTIFLGDQKQLIVLDHSKMTYAEMPMDIGKMVDEALAANEKDNAEAAEAKKRLGGLMKGLAKGMMGEMSVKVTETGETKKIGGWNCRKYLIEMNMGMGGTAGEAWATEDIKIDAGVYFTALNAMMAGQQGFDKIVKEMQKVKGVVVSQTSTAKMMGSEVTTTTELLECADKDAPAGTYEVPAGYKKVKSIK